MFKEENPDAWIVKAEHFFHCYQLSEEEKVEAAVMGLEGDALLWEHGRRPITRWRELKELLLRCFRAQKAG